MIDSNSRQISQILTVRLALDRHQTASWNICSSGRDYWPQSARVRKDMIHQAGNTRDEEQ